ncbi:amidohydrolase [Brevibacillus sp. TJ4]|uniref:amidohydrolase n=1 Tax=Brevibacillus sp. TJ4 TaxID=3234853 RepID=UPI0037D5FDF0
MQLEREKAMADEVRQDVIAWRRHFHRNPELSFQESRTADYVYETLQQFGGMQLSRPTKTSVVARLIGDRPGPVLAFRADMDALPIHEQNEVDYASEVPGVMHACGHDGHTAILLGAAKVLGKYRDRLCGEVRFLFQHAEEMPPGGAIELVQSGVLDGVDMIVGAHLMSHLETGSIVLKKGALFAGGDLFSITIQGRGGHGGLPHEAVDSVAIAAQVVTNLQQIVSRNVDPLESVVISTTKIIGGATNNVIPDSVELGGTTRYFKNEWKETLPRLMERIVKGVTDAHGASYTFQYNNGYLPLTNDSDVCRRIEEAGIGDLGATLITDMRPLTVGEDFSAYLQKIPGCFVLIGSGNAEKGIVYPHHHPRFDLDEDALSIGVNMYVRIASHILR